MLEGSVKSDVILTLSLLQIRESRSLLTLPVAFFPFTSFHSLTSPWDVWECQMYRIQIEDLS